MADEKDLGFKVTDRRKFNPDGSVKDFPAPPPQVAAMPEVTEAPAQHPEAPPPQVEAEAAQENVVSSPGEGAQKKVPPEEDNQAEEYKKQAASQAAQAYKQTNLSRPATPNHPSLLGLVNMLASEAAMFLGLIESPADGSVKVDLDSARELVDLLGVLELKTHGNLTREEEKAMEELLAYLRMQYVMAANKK